MLYLSYVTPDIDFDIEILGKKKACYSVTVVTATFP